MKKLLDAYHTLACLLFFDMWDSIGGSEGVAPTCIKRIGAYCLLQRIHEGSASLSPPFLTLLCSAWEADVYMCIHSSLSVTTGKGRGVLP